MGQSILASALAGLSMLATPSPAGVTLLGRASISGEAIDRSGLTSVIAEGIPQNRLGSFGSGIDFTGHDGLYIACDDRGPLDGKVPWRCRTQSIHIELASGQDQPLRVELVGTTLLSDEHGGPLVGAASAFEGVDRTLDTRFDPEGVRVSPAGTWWVCDEYGPWIDEFSSEGERLRRLAIPEKFRIEHPGAGPDQELPPHNVRGRQSNRGFEGLAISPDGTTLWALPQSPLLQDGALSAQGMRVGLNCRILEVSLATGKTREFVYTLEDPKHGVSELLAIDDHRLLVLERDSKGGDDAKFRRIFGVDLDGASDVSGVESLPRAGVPAGVVPAAKAQWLDFLDPRFGLGGHDMPEKIEGMTFGPALPDGRRTLVVTSDNDLDASELTWFWVFACDEADLRPAPPGVVPVR